jgi:hypothetical protein
LPQASGVSGELVPFQARQIKAVIESESTDYISGGPVKLATGTVVDGKIVVHGEALAEGSTVSLIVRDQDELFVVPPELERDLDESLAQAARGETVALDEALRQLRASH